MTRDVVLSLRARTTRHFAMAPAPARSQSGTTHASRLDDVFVWVCRMGVRVALIASPTAFVLVTLPYVARILVACVLCLCAFFAIATPCALAVAHAAWRDLDHPAPVTRFEPKCSSCDETELSKNSTLENKTAKQIRTVAVIGGGAAGIATLKQMKQQGFEVTLFEKSNDVGGLWRFGSAPGKVFQNVTQNLTKDHNRFAGLRPKDEWPLYLGHKKTQTYLRDTLDAVPGLRNCVRLLKEVVTIKETADGGGFEVTTRDVLGEHDVKSRNRASTSKTTARVFDATRDVLGEHDVKSRNRASTSKTTARVFDAVAVCTGQLSKPSVPGESEIPGLSSFTGQTLHTSEYLDCTSFLGKKVCVVGLGSASGADVAQDVCVAAARTVIAVRTHRWVMRRGLAGGVGSYLLSCTQRMPTLFGLLLALYSVKVPALKNLHCTPGATDSGDVLAAAALGKIAIKPAVASVSKDTVTFTDGTSAEFDVLIFATGFTRETGFLREHGEEGKESSDRASKKQSPSLSPHQAPGLYFQCLSTKNPRLAFVLFVLPFGSHFQVAETQASWIANVWAGQLGTPSLQNMRKHAAVMKKQCAHEKLGEFYRVQYLRLLSSVLFNSNSFVIVCAKLLTGARSVKYIDPVLEWGGGGVDGTTDAKGVDGTSAGGPGKEKKQPWRRADWRASSFA